MNINLEGLFASFIHKLIGFSVNFIDDFLCLLLSHWGIHWTWLQCCGYGLIVGKLIYWLVKLYRRRLILIQN